MIEKNFIDKAIAYISPKAGYQRTLFRNYEAAASGRRAKSMEKATSTGVNYEIGNALTNLRDRSRFFVRNNSWAKRAVSTIANNVVGEGIRPAPVGSKLQVKKAKTLWKTWGESVNCDWNGKNTIYGLQNLSMNEISESGEILIVRRRVKPTQDNPIPIKIQFLEADHLDHSKNNNIYKDGSFDRLGVKFNKLGQIEGYWIFEQHPTDGGLTLNSSSNFVSKDDCIHAFEVLRFGQIRGVPQGVSTFLKMSDFSDYEDAQLVRQKMAACYTANITSNTVPDTDLTKYLQPGLITYMQPGESVEFGNPPAAEGYDIYSKRILQGIAAGYQITYEMLTMDYSNVNFTSGRMAKIDVTGNFRKLQYNMIVPQICVPIWNWFMEACLMSGQMTIPVYCSSMDWTAPKIQLIDPTKETNAIIAQIQSGLQSLSEYHRENGRDFDEFIEEYKSDMQKCLDAGINISSMKLIPEINLQNNSENNL